MIKVSSEATVSYIQTHLGSCYGQFASGLARKLSPSRVFGRHATMATKLLRAVTGLRSTRAPYAAGDYDRVVQDGASGVYADRPALDVSAMPDRIYQR